MISAPAEAVVEVEAAAERSGSHLLVGMQGASHFEVVEEVRLTKSGYSPLVELIRTRFRLAA